MFKFAFLTTVLLNFAGEIRPIDADDRTPTQSAESSQSPVPVADSFTGSDSHLKAPQRLRITEQETWRRVGAQKNVFGFFVIPLDQRQLFLRRKTQDGWKEVAQLHALSSSPDVEITVGSTTPDATISEPFRSGPRSGPAMSPTAGISQAHVRAINIGFAFDPGQGQYDGVVGSPSDVWNFVDIGTTAVDYMRHPNTSSSTARLRITRHDGEWAVKTKNQIFRGYIYHNCQCVDLEATLLDVAPGRYRAYVYAHGDAPNQNANIEVIVGDRSLGEKPTTKSDSWEFQSSELKEGVQYVTFDFDVSAHDEIHIISHRDGSNYSMLNAIQLVPIANCLERSEDNRTRYKKSDDHRQPPVPRDAATISDQPHCDEEQVEDHAHDPVLR